MRILIRADGGTNIGMGHIMRTLTLAKELKKYFDVAYVCRTEEEDKTIKPGSRYSDGVHKVQVLGFKVFLIRADNLLEDLKDIKGDILITDSYDVDEEYFEATKKMFNKTIYIDDMCLYNFKNVDMIINQNVNAEDLDYILNTQTNYLLGCNYTMLREEFRSSHFKYIKRRAKDVMITFGGADPFLLTLKTLYYLKEEKYNFHVVVGPAFGEDYVSKLRSYEDYSNVNFYYNANMKALMEKCDVCISAAGSTLYELCVEGVPSLSVTVADNQIKVAEKFNNIGITKNLGWHDELNKEKILAELDNLSKNYGKRKEISDKGRNLVDGNGTLRIVEKILDIV